MRRAGRIGLVIVVSLTMFVSGGIGILGHLEVSPGSTVGLPSARGLAGPVLGSGSLTEAIASLQERLRAVPGDWRAYARLGLAYVQQARITADPSYYPKAGGALRRSLELDGSDNFEALVGMGGLALARHEFSEALRWGRRAAALNPDNGGVYGVVGDALLELGRYPAAFRTFQRMVDVRPDLSSYARASYARELQGDVRGAVRAMRLALQAAGTPEDEAWVDFHLGELYFNSGRLARAEGAYRRGVGLASRYVAPRAGLAKVAWARGDMERAIRLYTWVVARYPLPEYVIALGDLYAVSGQATEASRQYDLVRAEQALFRANGVNVDLELALFDADHGRPVAALAAARAEWARRRSVHVADAMAWALHANGRYRAAARYADRALALGTMNAQLLFHAGMIHRELGDDRRARELLSRALAVNPYFSILYSPVAEPALRALGGAR